jgi:uncharacterized protein YbjQ (UPF0145 family)
MSEIPDPSLPGSNLPESNQPDPPSAVAFNEGFFLPQAKVEPVSSSEPDPGPSKAFTPSIPQVIPQKMMLTNIGLIPGKAIREHYGLVSGSVVRSKHMVADLLADLKNLVGGELEAYTKLLEESREMAVERMKKQAEGFGANAIINVRFSTSSITHGAAEIFAYGTAVFVE